MRLKRDALDALFSDYIRHRDKWTCQICKKQFHGKPAPGLEAAHCFSRASKLIRWNPDNAAAVCTWCHKFGPNALDRHEGMKREWFKKRIGKKKFAMLEWMHHNPSKFQKPDKAAIKLWLKSEVKKFEGEIMGAH